MKTSLVAMIIGCAAASPVFAGFDTPPTAPPHAMQFDTPPTAPPHAAKFDTPPTAPPHAVLGGRPASPYI